MPYINISRILTDDQMIQLDVHASNGSQVTTQDFYIYQKELLEFGNELQNFPKNKDHVVTIEYGIEPNYYCYFMLKALVWDAPGHTSFEIKTNNRLEPPLEAESHFFLPCEAASINAFGKELSEWCNDMSEIFNYEWKSA